MNEGASIPLKRAMIVDDELSNRLIIKSLLKKIGYQSIEAENGAQAIELFHTEQPDIIFMDIMMPVLDGHEAVRRIRQINSSHFVPIIFLTAMTDAQSLAKCIEVGGDDFITKPFDHNIVRSKILAMERIRELHDQVSTLYGQMKKDEEMAESVFSGAVVADNVAMDHIHTLLRPAELFSGDVLLTAYAPSGAINVILGDFTGHGLAAAIGALPASEVFRAMTNKGFSPKQILSGINRKLHSLLPTGMFFAAQFLSISPSLRHVTVCNCGMPDILLLEANSRSIKHRFKSKSLPLSITPDIDFSDALEHHDIEIGDSLLLISDGVVEARSPERTYFGQARLEAAIHHTEAGQKATDSISQALQQFCLDAPQDDDISLAEIPCRPEILPHWEPHFFPRNHISKQAFTEQAVTGNTLEFSLTMNGSTLQKTDPIPLLINQLQEIEQLHHHRRTLFTILTELYVNAMDHGVLQLDSRLKQGPDGFTRYFSEREKRLKQLEEGFIAIRIKILTGTEGGELLIEVEDSGDGFSFEEHQHSTMPPAGMHSGRGIMLVKELCQSVHYEAPGNRVQVVFSWSNDG